jgi:hypothetical protein
MERSLPTDSLLHMGNSNPKVGTDSPRTANQRTGSRSRIGISQLKGNPQGKPLPLHLTPQHKETMIILLSFPVNQQSRVLGGECFVSLFHVISLCFPASSLLRKEI